MKVKNEKLLQMQERVPIKVLYLVYDTGGRDRTQFPMLPRKHYYSRLFLLILSNVTPSTFFHSIQPFAFLPRTTEAA